MFYGNSLGDLRDCDARHFGRYAMRRMTKNLPIIHQNTPISDLVPRLLTTPGDPPPHTSSNVDMSM